MEDLPVLSITGARVIEGFNQLEFSVNLSQPTVTDVTFDYLAIGATARETVDFDAESSSVTIPAGNTSATFNVRARGDDFVEPDEDFIVELSNPRGAKFADDAITTRARAVIEDDDSGDTRPSLFVGDVRIVEGDSGQSSAVFDVQLSRESSSAITLGYETRAGSAVAGEDFVDTSGSVSFAAGQTEQTVSVPILGDARPEISEAFHLAVSPSGDIRNGAQGAVGTATILDDDAGGGLQPTVTIADAQIVEGFNQLNFPVHLSAPAAQDVRVGYRAFGDTARATQDFDGESSFVTIPAGETSTFFNIRARGDDFVEPDESFIVELTNARGAVLAGGAPALRARGTVLDEDSTDQRPSLFVDDVVIAEGNVGRRDAVFDIALSRPSDSAITLAYTTVDGSATAGEDYQAASGNVTFAPGQTETSVAVPVIGDFPAEVTETFSLALTPTNDIRNGAEGAVGTARILDDDAGGGIQPAVSLDGGSQPEGFNQLDFTVRLSSPAAQDVRVTYQTFNGTALETSDFDAESSLVTIPAGETAASFNVRARGDDTVEPDENFIVELTNATGAVLAGGQNAIQAPGRIIDEDSTDARPSLFVDDVQVVEGRGGERLAVFDIYLSEPADQAIDLQYSTVDGTAVGGVDFAAVQGDLTMAAGQTTTAVAVPIFGDAAVEATESFGLAVTGADSNAVARGASGLQATGRILDDDAGGGFQPVLTLDDAAALEGFNQLDFSVHLSGPAAQAVTFEYRTITGSADGGVDFDTESSSVTIQAGETSAGFNIRARGDNQPEPNETFTVELSNIQGAAFAGGGNTLSATGTIIENVTLPGPGVPALTVDDVTVQEPGSGSGSATFTLSLPSPAGLSVTGDYQVLSGTAKAGQDFTPVSGSFTIGGGAQSTTISVPVLADNVTEDDETFVLKLSNLSNAQFPANESESVAIGTISANAGTEGTLPLLSLPPAEQIGAVYTAYFGRAPEPGGLDFWIGELQTDITEGRNSGDVLRDVASSFGVQPEAKDLFPLLQDPDNASRGEIEDFVNAVFQNLFNRGADPIGLDFWSNQVQAVLDGPGFVGNVIIDIVNGAQTTSAGNDAQTVRNKIEAGLAYSKEFKLRGADFAPEDDVPDARSVIQNVTDSQQSVADARALAEQLVAADTGQASALQGVAPAEDPGLFA